MNFGYKLRSPFTSLSVFSAYCLSVIMAVHMHMHIVVPVLAFYLFIATGSDPASSDKASLPKFAFSWLNDKDTFRAGDIATINIKVLEHADKLDKNAFKPALTVNGTMGNSSYVSGVHFDFEGDLSGPRIYFTVIMAGLFNVIIEENDFKVFDSSMHFQVQPGVVNSSRLSELNVILLCICAYPFPRTRNPPEDYLYSICLKTRSQRKLWSVLRNEVLYRNEDHSMAGF